MPIQRSSCLVVPGLASLFLLGRSAVPSFQGTAYAQILPDGTLGAESSLVTPDAFVRGDVADLIEGGATRGSALFHSFQDFNVNGGQRVYFANPIGIENILSRVTGLNGSEINGLLGVNGAANLFLLNPNGIIFGPNARLDVDGAFLASTSDRFLFADGTEFRATDPNDAPLVTVNIPLGLQLGPDAPAALISDADLEAGSDLTLSAGSVVSNGQLSAPNGTVRVEGVSGDVQVQAVDAESAVLEAEGNLILTESELVTMDDMSLIATDTVRIRDTSQAPFVASAGGDLLVEGAAEVDIFALNHPDSGLYSGGDLVLRSSTPVIGDANYLAYGDFRIEDMSESLGELLSPNDPIIRAAGNVKFASYEGASLHILAGGSVIVEGNITITNPDINNGLVEPNPIILSDGSEISINGKTKATLDIRAGTLAFGGDPTEGNLGGLTILDPPLFQPISNPAEIRIGSIFNNRPNGQVFLTTQYEPNPTVAGGNITITDDNAASTISRPGESISAFGNPVTIDARGNLVVLGNVTSGAGGAVDGGDIRLLSDNLVDIAGSVISLSEAANAGNVIIRGDNGIDVARVEARSIENGDSGFVNLISDNGGIDVGSGFGSITSSSADGSASFVRLIAEQDVNVGSITTLSESFSPAEDGGAVTLFSEEGSISINGLIETSTNISDSGNVTILASEIVTATNDIVTKSQDGNGGVIRISGGDGINLFGDLNSQTVTGDTSGLVDLSSEGLIFTRDITTSNQGAGTSGSIAITATGTNSEINTSLGVLSSEANQGNAGFISLSSVGDVTTNDVITQSIGGKSGNISIASVGGAVVTNGTLNSSTVTGFSSGDVQVLGNKGVETADITTKASLGACHFTERINR